MVSQSLLTPKRPSAAATASTASSSPPQSAAESYNALTHGNQVMEEREVADAKSYISVIMHQPHEYWLGRLTSLRSRVLNDADIAWEVTKMDKGPRAKQAELLIWKLCFVRLEQYCDSDEAVASLEEFRYAFVRQMNLPQLAARDKWFKEKGDGDSSLSFKIDDVLGNGPRVL